MKNEIRYKTITYDVIGQTAKNLDEFLESGYYLLELTHGVGDLGLPVGDCSNKHYMVAHLLVSDSGTVSTLQEGRMVGQTLILTNAAGAATRVYTRTAEFSKSGTLWSAWVDLGAAVTSDIQDGAITVEKLSSAVREKVDNPLRPLFIAAGAEYNDSGSDKTKTAPWGEQVTHKAAHYYLNGLGDITEEQMIEIYNYNNAIKYLPRREAYRGATVRTYFAENAISSSKDHQYTHSAFVNNVNLEVLRWEYASGKYDVASYRYYCEGAHNLFYGCLKLRIVFPIEMSNTQTTLDSSNFKNCYNLEEIRIYNLKLNTGFPESSKISKASILCTIQNATPTKPITITLHPDAYTRLANDTDIVAALQAQPLVTLVSA